MALDEETRVLVCRIVEGLGYRQLMLSNIRGHGLKFMPDVRAKLELVGVLELSLTQFLELERLYAQLGRADLVSGVRGRMDRVPYPVSRLELAVCLFLCEKVEHLAAEAYQESSCRELAALARTRLDVAKRPEHPSDAVFAEYCADASNRPHAQQLFNRWLSVALLSLGRPGSHGDARAVALELRSRHVAQIAHEFLASLQPFLAECQLVLPDATTLGLELPAPSATRGAGR